MHSLAKRDSHNNYELSESETVNQDLNNALQRANAQILELQTVISGNDQKLQTQLQNNQNKIAELEQEMNETQTHWIKDKKLLNEFRSNLRIKNGKILSLKGNISKLKEVLQQRGRDTREYQREINDLNTELRESQMIIGTNERQRTNVMSELQRLSEVLTVKDEKLGDLQKNNLKMIGKIEWYEQELSVKQSEIETFKNMETNNVQMFEEIKSELQRVNSENEQLKDRYYSLNEKNTESMRRNDALRKKIDLLRIENSELQSEIAKDKVLHQTRIRIRNELNERQSEILSLKQEIGEIKELNERLVLQSNEMKGKQSNCETHERVIKAQTKGIYDMNVLVNQQKQQIKMFRQNA